MQLNNTTNGRIIIIDDISIGQNRVIYLVYESILYDNNGIIKGFKIERKSHEFSSVVLKDKLNESINFFELCYSKLIEEIPEFSNYVISNDLQNWLFPEKPYRVTIDKNMNTNTAIENEAYKNLMDSMILKHAGYIEGKESVDKNVVMYVDMLKPEEISIVQDFIGIWIFTESKL